MIASELEKLVETITRDEIVAEPSHSGLDQASDLVLEFDQGICRAKKKGIPDGTPSFCDGM